MKKLLQAQEAVGMYYLANKKISTSILLLIGLCNYLFPSISYINFLLILVTITLGIYILENKFYKLIWIISSLFGLFLILSNILTISIYLVILVSLLLIKIHNRLDSSIILILILQLTFTQTLETLLSQSLLIFHLETLGPSLIVSILIFIFNYKKILPIFFTLILMIIFSKLSQYCNPISSMIVISLPTLFYALWINLYKNTEKNLYKEFIILTMFMSIWFFHPPKSTEKIYVLFPNTQNVYESKYFENYSKVLKFANIDAIETKDFSNIPNNSTILIPWVSDKIENYEKLNKFAKERKLTLILGGEHTNYNNIKTIINQITGYDLLSDDLTTPIDNSDYSGILRSNSIYPMPNKSIINRGASVHIPSFDSVVLFSGDGWWAEPNINEWLWVGDYSWEYGDRRGRLPLAININESGANFIVVGDNSFFVNFHLISNNDVIKCFINFATLWPVFINDFLITIFILLVLTTKKYLKRNFEINIAFLFVLYIVNYVIYPIEKSKEWGNYYIGEDSYDVKNFNKKFAKYPELWDSEYSLKRFKNSKDGIIDLKPGKNILFLIIDNEIKIGNVRLFDCKRLGSLDLEDIYIVDGQVCKIEGNNYKILLGNDQEATIIQIFDKEKETIVLLDKSFLSENSPDKNVKWLINKYINK